MPAPKNNTPAHACPRGIRIRNRDEKPTADDANEKGHVYVRRPCRHTWITHVWSRAFPKDVIGWIPGRVTDQDIQAVTPVAHLRSSAQTPLPHDGDRHGNIVVAVREEGSAALKCMLRRAEDPLPHNTVVWLPGSLATKPDVLEAWARLELHRANFEDFIKKHYPSLVTALDLDSNMCYMHEEVEMMWQAFCAARAGTGVKACT